MVSFIIDENHLRQLSAETRSELLQVIGAEIADLRSEFTDGEWDPEGNKSYPLSADEARVLIRGLGQPGRSLLRAFCLNYDGKVGSSELEEMLNTGGIAGYEQLGQEVSARFDEAADRLHLRRSQYAAEVWLAGEGDAARPADRS